MNSLHLALSPRGIPECLVIVIESYLNINSLVSWRAVNKQAYKDVEDKVMRRVIEMEELRGVQFLQMRGVRFIQEPVGPFLGSAWFQFVSNVYNCENCGEADTPIPTSYQERLQLNYDPEEAEQAQLCGSCFVKLIEVQACCKCRRFTNNGCSCHNCESFCCDDCQEDYIEMCWGCTELFCDECRLDTHCLNCGGLDTY